MKQKDLVKDYIKTSIREGKLIPGQYAPSERAICIALNVSRVTARNALNELVADKLLINLPKKGYLLPKANQKQNELKNNDILFLHEHDEEEFIADEQHNEIWRGAREVAVKNGYNIKISSISPNNFNMKKVKELKESYAGIVCDIFNKQFLNSLLEKSVPLVQIHGATEDVNLIKIVQDDFNGSLSLIRHVLQKSQKKMIIVEYSNGLRDFQKTYHNDRRLAAFQLAHFEKGLTLTSKDIISDHYYKPQYDLTAKKILQNGSDTIYLPFMAFYKGLQAAIYKQNPKAATKLKWVLWGEPPKIDTPNNVIAYSKWDAFEMGKEGAKEIIRIIPNGLRENKTILIPIQIFT